MAMTGTWELLGPLWKMLNKTGLIHTIFGRKAMMVVMYGGRGTDSDRNTIQRLGRCNVIYLHHFTHTILPHIVKIHKQVEIQMKDPTTKAPHKFADLGQVLIMGMMIPDTEKYALVAIIPILKGNNSGNAMITYRADSAYSKSLAKKISKNPPGWVFGYLRQVCRYNLSMVQMLMESFEIHQVGLTHFSTFDPESLVVTTEFGKTDELLESMEVDLGIDQVCWAADKEDGDGRQMNVEGHREAMEQ
jgi:hypothetical protein